MSMFTEIPTVAIDKEGNEYPEWLTPLMVAAYVNQLEPLVDEEKQDLRVQGVWRKAGHHSLFTLQQIQIPIPVPKKECDIELIARYSLMSTPFPPIVVTNDMTKILDGYLRYEAALSRQDPFINAYVAID